jgi:hypothetical protein
MSEPNLLTNRTTDVKCVCRKKDKDCKVRILWKCKRCGISAMYDCNRCMVCDPHTTHKEVTLTHCYDCGMTPCDDCQMGESNCCTEPPMNFGKPHDCFCQNSWNTGCCCMTATLDETQMEFCQNCHEFSGLFEEDEPRNIFGRIIQWIRSFF